jgi:hypothetical protein
MREQEGEFAGDGRCAVAGGGGVVPDLTGARMQAAAVRRPDLDVGGECDGTTGYSSGAWWRTSVAVEGGEWKASTWVSWTAGSRENFLFGEKPQKIVLFSVV